jgi:hypothetical protein
MGLGSYDDPLLGWMRSQKFGRAGLFGRRKARTRDKMLRRFLSTVKTETAKEKPDQWKVERVAAELEGPPVELGEEPVAEAMQLYSHILEVGRFGGDRIQSSLLYAIGMAAQEQTVTFWQNMFSVTIPRDRFSRKRKRFAAAALAWLFVKEGSNVAMDALLKACGNENEHARSEAVRHLRILCADEERTIPSAVWERIEAVAANDNAFQPRHLARMTLLEAEREVPGTEDEKVFGFEVKLKGFPGFRAVVETRAHSDFDILAGAILRAFGWDRDHLYEFHLTGKRGDDDFVIGKGDPFGWNYEMVDREPPPEPTIAESGIVPKHCFVFLFDFGDDHYFNVKTSYVADLEPGVSYPRAASTKGTPPEQYPDWD